MADEDQAIASEPAAIEQPTIAEQQPDEPQRIPDPSEEVTAEAPAEDDDYEDFDWNGKRVRGPKGLKDGVLMHADYTQKRQADAAKAKDLESREAEINRRHEATEAELDTRAELRAVNKQIEDYKAYDYAAYQQHHRQDPMAANEAWTYKQELQNQKAALEAQVGTAQKERSETAQRESAKRIQEATAFAEKNIPGWSDDLGVKMVEHAVGLGVPRDMLRDNMSPVLINLLHQAYVGKQTLSQPAMKPPPGPVQPLRVVNAKSNPTNRTDLASADMESYVAARKKGVGGKSAF